MQDLNTALAITETQSEITTTFNIKLDAASVFQSIQYEKEQRKRLVSITNVGNNRLLFVSFIHFLLFLAQL